MKKIGTVAILALSLVMVLMLTAFAAPSSQDPEIANQNAGSEVAKTIAYREVVGNQQCFDASLREIASTYASTSYAAQIANEASEIDISNYEIIEPVYVQLSSDTYRVETEAGEVIGTLHTEEPNNNSRALTAAWRIDNWTVSPGVWTGANSSFESYAGLTFSFDIDITPVGFSRVGIACHDTQTVVPFGYGSSGLTGSFTLSKDYGSVSFALKNACDVTLTYNGIYSV